MQVQIKQNHLDFKLEHHFNEIFFLLFFYLIFKFEIAVANEKIAFIDLNYIMNNSVAGKSINNFH